MIEHGGAQLDIVFHALADSTRRALLATVAAGPRPVGALAAPHAMSLAAVSKHLDVLERARLVRRDRLGTQRIVSLEPAPLKAAQDWLAFYQNFWSTGLDRLQTQLEASAPRKEG